MNLSRYGRFKPRAWEYVGPRRKPVQWLGECASGVSVGLIALPLALALGIASVPYGVDTPLPPPALGLLTAIIAGCLISLLGGSRVQIGGPTAAYVPIVLLIVSEHGYGGLLVATMMAGCLLIIMGLTRMGAIIRYIPWPVTSGFTTGIALSLILNQMPDLLGLRGEGPVPREAPEKLLWLGELLGVLNPWALGLSLACGLMIWFWPRLKIRFLPGSLVAMLIISGLVALPFMEGSVATIGSQFGGGAIPSSLPLPQLPHFDWAMLRELMGPALAIALLGAIESLLSAVVADGLSGDRHDSNTELVAQGVANLVCPFFGGLPATGAIARTSANVQNGAQTPFSGVVHAATLLLIVLLFSQVAGYIPMPAMAAILVVTALRMGEWHEWTRLSHMPVSDAAVLVLTTVLTVMFDLVVAVEVGMVLAAMLFIKRVAETTEVSRVTAYDELETPEQLAHGKTIPEGVLVYRVFGPFLFGAAEKMEDALARIEKWPEVLVLRLHLVSAMDATGMHALESVVERMQRHGSHVVISGVHRQPLRLFQKAGFIDLLGRENLCATFDEALERAQQLRRGQD